MLSAKRVPACTACSLLLSVTSCGGSSMARQTSSIWGWGWIWGVLWWPAWCVECMAGCMVACTVANQMDQSVSCCMVSMVMTWEAASELAWVVVTSAGQPKNSMSQRNVFAFCILAFTVSTRNSPSSRVIRSSDQQLSPSVSMEASKWSMVSMCSVKSLRSVLCTKGMWVSQSCPGWSMLLWRTSMASMMSAFCSLRAPIKGPSWLCGKPAILESPSGPDSAGNLAQY